MKRIIVFRFHKLPSICVERIAYLKRVNPHVKVFGLFGGESDQLPGMQNMVGPMLEDIFSIAEYAPGWKWRFSDLAIREWFINVGVDISFDVAHVIEWDLLLCKPLDALYSHIPYSNVGLTAIRSVKDIETYWPPTATEPLSLEWNNLLIWAQLTHHYSGDPLACFGPGFCLPRSFLEGYSAMKMPEISSDELRLPLAAQLLGIPITDTRLCRGWFMEEEVKIFNTVKKEILLPTILLELEQPKGRRAFHPFRSSLAEVSSFIAPDLHPKSVR